MGNLFFYDREREREAREKSLRSHLAAVKRLGDETPVCRRWQSTRREEAWCLDGISDPPNKNQPWNTYFLLQEMMHVVIA